MTGIRKEAHERALPEVTKELPFNVIMFGFDSLSRNAWIRKLPKAYKYMTEHLNADVLQGYNIVGDGTPQALIPVGFVFRLVKLLVFTLKLKFILKKKKILKKLLYIPAPHRLHRIGVARNT